MMRSSSGRKGFVDTIIQIQEDRAKEYTSLNRLLASSKNGNPLALRSGIQQATEKFQELSAKLMFLREEIGMGIATSDIIQIIDRIQHSESEKLRLTVEIHALRQSDLIENEDSPIGDEDTSERHNGCCHQVEMPLPREVRAALQEGYKKMETCIQNILDCMEELQYIKHDDDGNHDE